ncbi:hypothetical protein ACTG9Q_10000 [Actinokineospora sp. 24-640]
MTEDPTPKPQRTPPQRPTRTDLDHIFGDVLPDTTADERGDGTDPQDRDDDWHLRNRPPHHGG